MVLGIIENYAYNAYYDKDYSEYNRQESKIWPSLHNSRRLSKRISCKVERNTDYHRYSADDSENQTNKCETAHLDSRILRYAISEASLASQELTKLDTKKNCSELTLSLQNPTETR